MASHVVRSVFFTFYCDFCRLMFRVGMESGMRCRCFHCQMKCRQFFNKRTWQASVITTDECVPATFSIWFFLVCLLLLLVSIVTYSNHHAVTLDTRHITISSCSLQSWSVSWKGNHASVLWCFTSMCQMLFLPFIVTPPETALPTSGPPCVKYDYEDENEQN